MPDSPHSRRAATPRSRSSSKDVAQLAGVSTATVSRAMNNPDAVDPETLARVRAAADKLRYVPHGGARSLRSHRTRMIGAVVPSMEYALYARTTSAVHQRVNAQGYALVLAEHHYDLDAELRVASQLVQHGMDAFVFVGLDHHPALFSLLEDYGRPYVLTWGVDPLRRHPSVGFDNQAAAYQVTRHLIELGHRRIGLLSAPLGGNDRAMARGQGMRAALAEAGLALDPRHVQYAPIHLGTAEQGMSRLISLPDRPTAVVATNDIFAVGGMIACRKAGLRIPRDMSITGIDNTDLGATQTPGLTSVRTPIIEIGHAAAEQLIARLEGKEFEAFQSFPIEVVYRGSTAPPGGGALR
ncbi:LacI family DNA-binding transcriptional regulator [Parapusillimonas granuli]|uniref:LacI family DNA-binding transcriptional regulator n=1 Tax=Parapusillimonas granuli TaxID=380911 RepID=A0A853G0K4_9BURK|nr:LacI family DNA-binding transcriptional regulator [Parapusillimonas granuli]MBB5215486.1 LacI family transcriptional regulator [Parapusillimonas granuli]MEB2400323.1 LacI family DNA-binding transcriptional regulator [Alcaligenaceae bacterium]NYT49847.1 LacI family DNA-binding transcriptional regulator [Parapusillimonas granuli]